MQLTQNNTNTTPASTWEYPQIAELIEVAVNNFIEEYPHLHVNSFFLSCDSIVILVDGRLH